MVIRHLERLNRAPFAPHSPPIRAPLESQANMRVAGHLHRKCRVKRASEAEMDKCRVFKTTLWLDRKRGRTTYPLSGGGVETGDRSMAACGVLRSRPPAERIEHARLDRWRNSQHGPRVRRSPRLRRDVRRPWALEYNRFAVERKKRLQLNRLPRSVIA